MASLLTLGLELSVSMCLKTPKIDISIFETFGNVKIYDSTKPNEIIERLKEECPVFYADNLDYFANILAEEYDTLTDIWEGGVKEGGSRCGNFEWGKNRKDISFKEWAEDNFQQSI